MTTHFTWSSDWIQDYESPWGILEKFIWANAVDANIILGLIGDRNVKQLKNISNAGSSHRSLIYLNSVDPNLTKQILGIDLIEYHETLLKNVFHEQPSNKILDKYFRNNLSYCPICYSEGYHSILHQLKLFDKCAFHPEQDLSNHCLNCNTIMPEYMINKGSREAYRCKCGHHFLNSTNFQTIYSLWRGQPKIKNKTINLWLQISKEKNDQYHIIYPFENYQKYHEVNKGDVDYLQFLPKLYINSFHKNIFKDNVIEISSKANIFDVKDDFKQLKENYMKTFPYLFTFGSFKEKHKVDSIYFEIYKQSRIIYKSITRYILRKVMKEHSNCVKVFNKARISGDVCPHALAFISWKMECEGKDNYWQLEWENKVSGNFGFKCMEEGYSIFSHGVFMTHLFEILNPTTREGKHDFTDCNLSSTHYILNKVISYLLIERFIKWLEVVKNPKKFKHYYPDDNIPMYIAKIPCKKDEEISFYFPNKRIDYMKTLIKEISNQSKCPFHKSKKYYPYKTPIQKIIDEM